MLTCIMPVIVAHTKREWKRASYLRSAVKPAAVEYTVCYKIMIMGQLVWYFGTIWTTIIGWN